MTNGSRAAGERAVGDERVLGTYVYCVGAAELPEALGPIGLDAAEVTTVCAGPLAAVVSAAWLATGAAGPLPTRAHLLAHDFAIAAAARQHTVLPVAFGTVFRSTADVRAMLRSGREAIQRVLAEIGARVEVSVQALCTQRNPEAARAAAEQAYDTLAGLADAARPLAPIGDRMMLHAAFLVPRARAAAFLDAARGCGDADGAPLALRVSSPRAPFHFARVTLRAVDAVDTADARAAS